MKTNLLKTGTALLLALTLTVSAKAQTSTTKMNSTLIPQSWSNLPIVKGNDVKGGMHELGTVDVSGGAQIAINALTGNQQLPVTKRTVGMVVGLLDASAQYRQYILMDDSGDTNAANDVWQEILITSAWKASTTYVAGDPVSYVGATYFKIENGDSDATFTSANWYGVSNSGDASLASVILGGSSLDSIATSAAEVEAGGGSTSKVVTGAALIEYVSDQLDDIIEAGTATGQTLVWNNVTEAWEASSALTNDGTDVTATGTINANELSTGEFTVDEDGDIATSGDASVEGMVTVGDGTNDVVIDGATGDITAAGTITADSLSTTEFTVDTDGNVITTGDITGATINTSGDASIGGNANVTGNVTADDITATGDLSGATLSVGGGDLTVDVDGNTNTAGTLTVAGTATMNGDVVLNDDASETTTVNGSLILNDDVTLDGTRVSGVAVSGGTLNDSDTTLITEGAVKEYVDDQLGSGGSLYYGSDGTFNVVNTLANDAAIEAYTAVAKSDITSEVVDLDNGQFFFVAVPTNWGALNMFIEDSPMFDGFTKQVVGTYNVYVLQFAISNPNDADLTFAIK